MMAEAAGDSEIHSMPVYVYSRVEPHLGISDQHTLLALLRSPPPYSPNAARKRTGLVFS